MFNLCNGLHGNTIFFPIQYLHNQIIGFVILERKKGETSFCVFIYFHCWSLVPSGHVNYIRRNRIDKFNIQKVFRRLFVCIPVCIINESKIVYQMKRLWVVTFLCKRAEELGLFVIPVVSIFNWNQFNYIK